MRKAFHIALIVAAFAATISSCDSKTVYDKYQHTPVEGWERDDTIHFDIPKIKQKGTYEAAIGLRVNDCYPFAELTLVVERRILPAGQTALDTLRCILTDDNGLKTGYGVSRRQHTFDISPMQLDEGDSLHVSIKHDMRMESLPGVTDVGMMLRDN